jgi:hypothetical protein
MAEDNKKEVEFSIKYLKSVTEEQALKDLPMYNKQVVKKAWKSANGKLDEEFVKKQD